MRHAEQGFTLIELLIAFVIAAGGLTALFQLLSGNMAGMSRAQAREHATLIAQSRMAALQASKRLAPTELTGQADHRFNWVTSVKPYGPALKTRQGEAMPLYMLTVTVHWRDGASVQQVSLDSLHLTLPTAPQP